MTEYTEEVSGTYTRDGNNLTLTVEGEHLAGTLSGGTLTLVGAEGRESLTFQS